MSKREIIEGRAYELDYPFVRSTYEGYDEDGPLSTPSWKPGTESFACAPDDCEDVADAVGRVIYTVVSVHRLPKPYASRVFFVREWINPDGKRFGKKQLRILGISAFSSRLNGFRYQYRLRQSVAA
jgi:hypothetical protein